MPKISIDLKRKFVNIGRYRYLLHKVDMEPWRDRVCPVCEKAFESEPHYYMNSRGIHNTCTFTPAYDAWVSSFDDEDYW